jgi:hypothetical protein
MGGKKEEKRLKRTRKPLSHAVAVLTNGSHRDADASLPRPLRGRHQSPRRGLLAACGGCWWRSPLGVRWGTLRIPQRTA